MGNTLHSTHITNFHLWTDSKKRQDTLTLGGNSWKIGQPRHQDKYRKHPMSSTHFFRESFMDRQARSVRYSLRALTVNMCDQVIPRTSGVTVVKT